MPAAARARAVAGLLRAAWQEYERDYARYFASGMVYYALVSLVPVLLLLLSAVGLVLRLTDFGASAQQNVLAAIENGFGLEMRTTIEQLIAGLEQQSVVASVVSLIGLALTASMLMRHLRMSFRAIWKFAPPLIAGPLRVVIRVTILERVISFGMVFGGCLLLLLVFALVEGFNRLTPLFSGDWALVVPGSLVVVPLAFAFLFRFLPPERLAWRHVWLAAALCALAWAIGVQVLALYGRFFGKNFNAYGAIGGLLVIMLWMKAVSQCLFFGAELCKIIVWRERETA
jgi:membrane protein